MSITVCDCVWCAISCVRCTAVRHSNACSDVLQCAAKRTAVSGSTAVCAVVCAVVCGCPAVCVWQCAAVQQCGNVRLSSGAAVCGSLAVSIFSNKFKTYSHKFAEIRNKSDLLRLDKI
jgi:hypothetical protein